MIAPSNARSIGKVNLFEIGDSVIPLGVTIEGCAVQSECLVTRSVSYFLEKTSR